MSMFSRKNSHLLSALGRILTQGAVDQVIINENSPGAMNVRRRGETKSKVILPTPDQFPEGFTEQAAQGLADHEFAHGLFTKGDGPTVNVSSWPEFSTPDSLFAAFEEFVKGFHNTLEDRRIEPLYAKKYPGGGENIDALNTYAVQILIPLQLNEPKIPTLAKIDLALNTFMMKGLSKEIGELATWTDTITDIKALEAIGIAMDLRGEGIAAVAAAKTDTELNAPAVKISAEIFRRMSKSDVQEQMDKAQRSIDQKKKLDELRKNLKEALKQALEDLKEKLEKKEKLEEKVKDLKDRQAKGEDVADELAEAEKELEEAKNDLKGPAGPPMPGGSGSGTPSFGFAEEKADDGTLGLGGVNEHVLEQMPKSDDLSEEEKESLQEALDTGLMVPSYMDTSDVKSNPKRVTSAIDAILNRDSVQHLKPQAEKYAALKNDLASSIAALSRVLRLNLDAQARVKTLHEQDSGDIDKKALHKLAVGTSDQVFYVRKRAKHLDTAVSVLVDLSGSMEGGKLTHAVRLCTALYEALKALKIDVEILGFTTGYDHNVEVRSSAVHYIAKSFRDKTPFCIPSFFDVPHRCNADPDAIRWAARRLLANPCDRRILLVISDGQPSCSVNNSGRMGGNALEEDLRAAITSCLKYHIEVIGFGIQDAYVKDYYPWPVVVNDVSSLTMDVLSTLKQALTAAPGESLRRMEQISRKK